MVMIIRQLFGHEYFSLLSDAVDGLASTQAHERIDMFMTGSAKRYMGAQCVCANRWIAPLTFHTAIVVLKSA